MSENTKLHNHIGVYNGVNYKMVNDALYALSKNIGGRDPKEIYRMKLFGYEFDVLPFLIHASSWFSNYARGKLLSTVTVLSEGRKLFKLDQLNDFSDLFDVNVYNALLPTVQAECVREGALYLMVNNIKALNKFLYVGASECYQQIVVECSYPHLNYGYKDIANTQALCYYLCALWLCQLEPRLFQFMGRQIAKSHLQELLDGFLPRGSLHHRYIAGEITGEELYTLYEESSFSDGSSIHDRELLSYMTNGVYTGEDITSFTLDILHEYEKGFRASTEYHTNLLVGYCLLKGNTMDVLETERDDYKYKLGVVHEDLDNQKKRNKQMSEECTALREELRRCKAEINSLESKVASCRTDEELSRELLITKNELSALESENMELMNDYMCIKREVRQEKRKVKSLTATLDAVSPKAHDSGVDFPEKEVFDQAEVLDYLKDKRIVFVGNETNNDIVVRLRKMGVPSVKLLKSNTRSIGAVDILVILAGYVKHSLVWRALNMSGNAQRLYFNGTNIDEFLRVVSETTLG